MTQNVGKILIIVDRRADLTGLTASLASFGIDLVRASADTHGQLLEGTEPDLILAPPQMLKQGPFHALLDKRRYVALIDPGDDVEVGEAMALGARSFLEKGRQLDSQDAIEMLRGQVELAQVDQEAKSEKSAESAEKLKRQVQELRERYILQGRYFNESQDVFYLDLARMMTIVDNIMDGIVFTDPEGKITLMNPIAEGLLGVKAMVAIGKSCRELQGGTELLSAIRADQEAATHDGNGATCRTVEVHHSTQDLLYLSLRTTGVTDYKGSFAGVLTVIKDVTVEIKSDQMRNQYLSIVSHELRTPLTGIKTFATLLSQGTLGDLSEKPQDAVDSICDSTLRLEHEVDKLICLSTIESGHFALDLVEFDLRQVLDGVTAPFDSVASERGIHLLLNMPLPGVLVMGDQENLRRAIQALIENAVKFTPDGGCIDIFVTENAGKVEIHIKDDGPGVDPRYQRRIFEMFYQVEDPLTRHHGGAGLGLPLAQGVAEAHQGVVSLRSVPGQGADFYISLPLVCSSAEAREYEFNPVSVKEEA